ncbi:MAG: translocation/assembly module TamB domain-containing protein [Bacteroidota bacterium]
MAELDAPPHTDASASPDPPPTPPSRTAGGTAWRVAGGLVAGLLLLPVLLLLVVQTPWGAEAAKNAVLSRLAIFEGARLEVGTLDGSVVRGLTLHDVRLVHDDGTVLARIDTLDARYRLRPLLARTLDLEAVRVHGVSVILTQQADSTWDLLNVLPPSDTAASPWRVRVGALRLDALQAAARFYAPSRDSTYRIEDLAARVTNLEVGGELALTLDDLQGRLRPSEALTPVDLQVQAGLEQQRLTVRTLSLRSERSDVAAEGTLTLPADTAQAPLEAARFTLRAAPLALVDIYPLVPQLNPDEQLTLDVQAETDGTTAQATGTVAVAGGGTLRFQAASALPHTGRTAYTAEAEIEALTPTLLAPPVLEAPLNATLRLDVQGEALNRLSGTARLRVAPTAVRGVAVDSVQVGAALTDGRVRLDGRAGAEGATLTVGGALRPFAEVPTYAITGRVEALNLAAFADSAGVPSDLTATFAVIGEGFALEALDTDVTLQMLPSTLQGVAVEAASLDAQVQGLQATARTEIQLRDGRVALDGSVQFGERLQLEVTQGRVEGLNLAALLEDTTRTDLNAQFTLRGQRTAVGALTLNGQVRLDPSRYGIYAVDQGTVDLALEDEQLRTRVQAMLGSGRVDLAATARPFAAVPTFSLTQGRFENLDVGAFMGRPPLSSNLTGTLTADAQGLDPATLRATGQLTLQPSSVNDQEVSEARVDIGLDGGTVILDAYVDTPEGGLRLAATAEPFLERPTYAVREARFDRLQLGRLVGSEALRTDLTGTASLSGRGFDPATLRADVRLRLEPSRINRQRLDRGELVMAMQEGFADVTGRFDLAEAPGAAPDSTARFVDLTARGRFLDDQPTYAARLSVDRLDVDALAGLDTTEAFVTAELDLKGEGLSLTTMAAQGRLAVREASYDEIQVEAAEAIFDIRDGLAVVDTLTVRSNVLRATGSGTVALTDAEESRSSDLRFEADLLALAPLQPLLRAEPLSVQRGRLEGRVYGRPGTLRLEVGVDVESLAYNQVRLAGLDLSVRGEFAQDRTLALAELRGTMDYASVPTFVAEQTQVEAVYQDSTVQLNLAMKVDDRRDAQVTGTVDLRPGREQVEIDDLNLRFDNDRWALLLPATISYGEVYRVRNLLLATGEGNETQQLALDGAIDFNGTQTLGLTVENFRIDAVADLLGFEGLGGTLNGDLGLSGRAAAPEAGGRLYLDLRSQERDVGTLSVDVRYDSLRLNLDTRLVHAERGTLTAAGYLPLDLRLTTAGEEGQRVAVTDATIQDRAVAFDVEADQFDIGWVEPFLDPTVAREVEGMLSMDIEVRGTFAQPELAGEATLRRGQVELPDLGVTYTNMEVEARAEGDQVRLERARLTNGPGRVTATGTIDLTDLSLGEFDLDLDAREFLAIDTEAYRVVANGDLQLAGTTDAPTLRGDIDVISADLFLVETTTNTDVAVVELTEADVRMLERYFGIRVTEADTSTFSFYEALDLDLGINLARDTWVRSRGNLKMDIQFTGDLELEKAPFEEEQAFGSIEVIPERSSIVQFGKEFDLVSGTLTFSGLATNPELAIRAEYPVPRQATVIELAAEGSVDRLDITFNSRDPDNMEQLDIVSYILTGKPANESFTLGGEGGSLGGRTLQAGAGQLASLLEGVASRELALDVIEIAPDGSRLTAGKFFRIRQPPCETIFAALSLPLLTDDQATVGTASEGQTEATLECELVEWLLIRVQGTAENVRLNLLWQYSY